jgi:hypothetical protein
VGLRVSPCSYPAAIGDVGGLRCAKAAGCGRGCWRARSSRGQMSWRRRRQIGGGWQSSTLAKAPRLLVEVNTVLSVVARGWCSEGG